MEPNEFEKVAGPNSELNEAKGVGKDFGPGHLNITGQIPGHYSRCAVEMVAGYGTSVADAINNWAASHQGFVVVNIQVIDSQTALITYTRTLDDETIEVLNEWGAEIQAKVEKNAQARREAEATAEKTKREEEKRLMDLGRKCLANHKKDKPSEF